MSGRPCAGVVEVAKRFIGADKLWMKRLPRLPYAASVSTTTSRQYPIPGPSIYIHSPCPVSMLHSHIDTRLYIHGYDGYPISVLQSVTNTCLYIHGMTDIQCRALYSVTEIHYKSMDMTDIPYTCIQALKSARYNGAYFSDEDSEEKREAD